MTSKILRFVPALLLIAGSGVFAKGASVESADVIGQGPAGPIVSIDGARLVRTKNGLNASVKLPTPAPGSYAYPAPNGFQPVVLQGAPEVFTGWIFIFNNPAQCSGGVCDSNDLGNTPAMGGAYNFAGHVVGGSTLNLSGHVKVGSAPFAGVPLSNPAGAEVHLAIAPHGTVQPDLLPTQITTPIGGPPNWWLAFFLP